MAELVRLTKGTTKIDVQAATVPAFLAKGWIRPDSPAAAPAVPKERKNKPAAPVN